jgi:hypothetical protein
MQKDSVDPSLQALTVIGAGRGALVVSMFGAGWIAWGLGAGKLFSKIVGPVYGFLALLLWVCAVYTIRKGGELRKKYSTAFDSGFRAVRRPYIIIVVTEFVAIALAFFVANGIFHRPELGPDWCAIVVGVHFLPLAKIFRAPALGVFGVLIALWGLVCWAVFRSDAVVISVTLGTGILLWAAAVSALVRARQIARVLS